MNKNIILAGLLATSVTYIHVSYGAGSVTGFSLQTASNTSQSVAASQHSPGYYQPRMRTAPQPYVAPTPKAQRPYSQHRVAPQQPADTGKVAPTGRVGLNPQSEPPSSYQAPGGKVGLNPQPEPPSRYQAPQGKVGLNPQPEPPSKQYIPGY